MRTADFVALLNDLFSHRPYNARPKAVPNSDKEFVVIGLGRFGSSLAKTLVARGHIVVGIDRDPALVQALADEITQTLSFDTTNIEILRNAGIAAFDTVVVAIGTNFEANIMTTVALNEIGVANIVCKAATKKQRDILLAVGAHRVVLPEYESGERIALELSNPRIVEQVGLPDGAVIGEVHAPPRFDGLQISEAEREGAFTIVGIVRDGKTIARPANFDRIVEGDVLVVLGEERAVAKLADG